MFASLFDVDLLSRLVPLQFDNVTARGWTDTSYTTLPRSCGSSCARDTYSCARHPKLERVQTGFWFQACLQGTVDTTHLARRTEALLGLPSGHYDAATVPSLALLRSGLFYSRPLKATARRIRKLIGGRYSAIHLRRSDKLKAAGASQAVARDRATQPSTLLALLRKWAPPGATLYIGSTEPAPFFAPMAPSYRLLFGSNFSALLQPLTNNYAKYAVESLVFVGAELYVETYGYTRGNYMRGCFPFHVPPKGGAGGGAAKAQQALVFGVAYGRACSRACHDELHLIPSPRQSCTREGGDRLLIARARGE